LFQFVRNLLKAESAVPATLVEKKQIVFPQTVFSVRRDRIDYYLSFRTDVGRVLQLKVTKAVYDVLEKQNSGLLTYKGDWYQSFQMGAVLIPANYDSHEPDSKE
jgi:hypothetical protein